MCLEIHGVLAFQLPASGAYAEVGDKLSELLHFGTGNYVVFLRWDGGLVPARDFSRGQGFYLAYAVRYCASSFTK